MHLHSFFFASFSAFARLLLARARGVRHGVHRGVHRDHHDDRRDRPPHGRHEARPRP